MGIFCRECAFIFIKVAKLSLGALPETPAVGYICVAKSPLVPEALSELFFHAMQCRHPPSLLWSARIL